MADDAGRDPGDSTSARAADGSGGQSDVPSWDETMHKAAVDEDGDEDASGNVAGQFQPSTTIEPESPSLENSLFVVFGAYIAILGLTRLFIDSQGFDARDVAVLTGGTLLVSIVLLGFLGLLTPDT